LEQQMKAGDEIVRQGEPGDRFYVIDSGSVEVVVDGRPGASLGPGDYFGEIALLRDVPRTATVRAREDGLLLTLTHDAFVPAVSGYSPSLASAEAVVGLRLGPARAGIVRA
jgi:CRP-like cAMP-binding protein